MDQNKSKYRTIPLDQSDHSFLHGFRGQTTAHSSVTDQLQPAILIYFLLVRVGLEQETQLQTEKIQANH